MKYPERREWWIIALTYLPMLLFYLFLVGITWQYSGWKFGVKITAIVLYLPIAYMFGGMIGCVIYELFQSEDWRKEHEWEWD